MSHQLPSVVILAGGMATRLRPVTEKIPKSLIEINGEPFIFHQLRLLRENGIKKIVICAGFLGEQIRDVVGDGSAFGLNISFSFDGPNLLGTAGAIRHAFRYLDECFFTLYGDSYLMCDYADIYRSFLVSGKSALMTVYRNQGKYDGSNVEFSDGAIKAYDKRVITPAMHHIDFGLGIFKRVSFANLSEDKPSDLAIIYREHLAADSLAGYEVTNRFYEIGSFTGIEELKQLLTNHNQGIP